MMHAQAFPEPIDAPIEPPAVPLPGEDLPGIDGPDIQLPPMEEPVPAV